jgi:O-antigen/teichoic acid export membrane protein
MRKNVFLNLIYQLIILVIPLITYPYISRVLGVGGVGTYSYTYSIANIFCLFAMLGINNYGNREIARFDSEDNKRKLFWQIIYFRCFSTTIAIIIYFLIIFIFFNTQIEIFMCQFILLFGAFIDLNWVYYGLEKVKPLIIKNLLIKTISTILIFVLIKNSGDLILYIIILSLSQVLGQVLLWPSILKRFPPTKVNLKSIFIHAKPMLILFIPIIGLSIYRLIDKTMIGLYLGDIECGYYESADKIVNLCLMVLSAVGTVLVPRISLLEGEKNKAKINNILYYSFLFIIFLSIAMMFGIFAISKKFVPIFFGDEYKPTINILIVLSCSMFFSSLSNTIRAGILIPKHKDKEYAIVIIVGAVVDIILNLIFMLVFKKTIYVALATVISEIITFFMQFFVCRKCFNFKKLIIPLIFCLVSGALMFLCLYFLQIYLNINPVIDLIIVIVIGIVTYVLFFLLLMLIFRRNDLINILKSLKHN